MPDLLRILPFILGAAVSPVLLVTCLYLLSLPTEPIKKALQYLIGATATISLITFVIFYSTNINPNRSSGNDLIAHIIIGLLLLYLAFDIYKKGPAKANKQPAKKQSGWRFLITGVVLMLVNFSTIAMIFEVAIELRANGIIGTAKDIYLLVTILSSLLPILLPLLLLIVAGKHSKDILKSLSSFMNKYSHIVTAVFFAVLGAFCLLKPFI